MYSNDNTEISKFEGFDHKILGFSSLINISRSEMAFFCSSEQTNLIIELCSKKFVDCYFK